MEHLVLDLQLLSDTPQHFNFLLGLLVNEGLLLAFFDFSVGQLRHLIALRLKHLDQAILHDKLLILAAS